MVDKNYSAIVITIANVTKMLLRVTKSSKSNSKIKQN